MTVTLALFLVLRTLIQKGGTHFLHYSMMAAHGVDVWHRFIAH